MPNEDMPNEDVDRVNKIQKFLIAIGRHFGKQNVRVEHGNEGTRNEKIELFLHLNENINLEEVGPTIKATLKKTGASRYFKIFGD